MAYVSVYMIYDIDVPEIDEIYNSSDDPDVVDANVDDILQEIQDNPLYFIERNGYELTVEDVVL